MATQMGGFISVGMRPSRIDLYSIDTNISPDEYRGTPVEAKKFSPTFIGER